MGYIETEYLPPYALEINWEPQQLPNVCPTDCWELDGRSRQALRRMRKPRLGTAS